MTKATITTRVKSINTGSFQQQATEASVPAMVSIEIRLTDGRVKTMSFLIDTDGSIEAQNSLFPWGVSF